PTPYGKAEGESIFDPIALPPPSSIYSPPTHATSCSHSQEKPNKRLRNWRNLNRTFCAEVGNVVIHATRLSRHARIFSSLEVLISLSVLPETLRRGLHPMPSWFPMRPTALAVPRSRCSTRLWLASWKRFWHHSKITSGMYRASSRRS